MLYSPAHLHIPDGFLSLVVSLVCWAAAAVVLSMAVSRTKEGGQALMVFSIDTAATAELFDALHDVGFDDVRFVELG